MKRKRLTNGFTLVELLVVISIIALLVSILLPSLNKAREQAKKAVCASNIRQLALGAVLFAEDHDGKLPWIDYNAAWTLPVIYWYNYSDGVNGFGVLVEEKYIDTPEAYYCPSMRNPWWAFETDLNPWFQNHRDLADPLHYIHTRSSFVLNKRGPNKKMKHIGSRAFICDIFFSNVDWAHKGSSGGWNVGYGDTHVTFFVDAGRVTNDLASFGNPQYEWEYNEPFSDGYTKDTKTEILFKLFDQNP